MRIRVVMAGGLVAWAGAAYGQIFNIPPSANNDNATTNRDTPVSINVVSNDTDLDGTIDPATVDLDLPKGGIQSNAHTPQGDFVANASGIVTFTPKKNFTGTATIRYKINDDDGATSIFAGTITITVSDVNDPP